MRADEYGELLQKLTDPIRRMAAMSRDGASCENIGSSVAESLHAMLPNSRAIVLLVEADGSKATVVSTRNAPHVEVGEEFDVPGNAALMHAVSAAGVVLRSPFDPANPLFTALAGFRSSGAECLLSIANPRDDGSLSLLSLVVEPDDVVAGTAVLAMLGELLRALCAGLTASRLHDESLGAIARAKREWERTVDSLPEIVFLINDQGGVIRANRTVERWHLGEVTNVRGKNVHAILHPNCRREHCALKDAVSARLASRSSNGFLETALTDPDLGRTIIVHTKPMDGARLLQGGAPAVAAVVVVSDISALHKAQQDLEDINADLEHRVEIRTRELEQSNTELAEEVTKRREAELNLKWSRDELAELSTQLINAQEDERRRLSRELHDSLGQTLGAIKYSLERIAAMQETTVPGDTQAELESVVASITAAIQETRALALNLRPPVLDDLGTASALGWLIERFAETYEDTAFHIETGVTNHEIPRELATPVYRITQEALSNVVKHARAKTALVSLQLDDDVLRLEVLDDGVGFNNSTADTGQFRRLGKVGRLGMRERAASTHGQLEILSGEGQGTRVIAEWHMDNFR